MRSFAIEEKRAPALGDVRTAMPGDVIRIREGAQRRKDWPRYLEAIACAVGRGADVLWER